MTTNHEHDGEDELLAARRTAHALGQTEGAEQAEVAAELAASPQARQEVEAVQALAARLKEAAREAPQPEPSPAMREAIERRLSELEPAAGRTAEQTKARPWWRSRMAALALTAACLVALAVPIGRSINLLRPGKDPEVANQAADGAISSRDSAEGANANQLADEVLVPTCPKRAQVDASEFSNLELGSNPSKIHYGVNSGGILPASLGITGSNPSKIHYDVNSLQDACFGEGEPRLPMKADGVVIGGAVLAIAGSDLQSFAEKDLKDHNAGYPWFSAATKEELKPEAIMARYYDQNDSGNRALALVQPDRIGATTGATVGGADKYSGAGSTEGMIIIGAGSVTLGSLAGNDSRAGTDGGFNYRDFNDDNRRRVGGDSSRGGQYQGHDTTTTDETRAQVAKDAESVRADEGGQKPSADIKRPELLIIEAIHDRRADDSARSGESLAPADVVDIQSIRASERRLKASQLYKVEPVKPRQDKPESKTPLETWKPAHVVPNSSRLMVGDREELPLKGMQVDVRVDGFRARVLIDVYYFNDRPQQLEGNFQVRLPDEASPYFFAFGRTVYQAPQVTASDSMFFKPQQVSQGDTTPEKILALRGNSWEQPKVARMVPKEKAALAYRDTVRRRVDPALVEWSGAGVFQCRVFPLAPQSLHRVTIGYNVDLLSVGDDLELRLDLPGQTPATIVDLNIAASDARQVSLDAPATTSADGQRLSYRLIDPKERPLAVRLRKPGTQMLTGNDEATGSYFATRVGLTLPETPSADRPKQAIFLVDTSLSAGPQFPLWTKLLRATLENNRDGIREFAVVFFNVETFWWQEKFVANTPENVDALLDYADGLVLEGATDLGRALKEAAAPAWQGRVGFNPPPLGPVGGQLEGGTCGLTLCFSHGAGRR
ncbi:MAG: hypothetical protein ABSG53_14260 [Thermoguttaceae bacterium]